MPARTFAQVEEVALLAAAMHVCDRYGDGAEARAQIRRDCLGTPAHLRADLLAHLREAAKVNPWEKVR